ncbi:MAG: plasmid maintenance system antidote protein VapI [Phenylobacterium sp.]|jgi:plasmid maintenance system antidote protein VapI
MNAKNLFYPADVDFSDAVKRTSAREDLVYNVTEDLLVILEDMNISKKELARRLGKSRSYVTQILSGSRNMTLGTLSDICYALGFTPQIKLPVQAAKATVDVAGASPVKQSLCIAK